MFITKYKISLDIFLSYIIYYIAKAQFINNKNTHNQ